MPTLILGFDPAPIKLFWTVVAIIALGYCIRNLIDALRDKHWSESHMDGARIERRIRVARTNVRVHQILTSKALFMLIAGFGSVLTPKPAPLGYITLGSTLVVLLLILDELGIALLSFYYNRTRRILGAEDLQHAQSAPVPIDAPDKTFTATATDPSGMLDVKVDVELHRPKDADVA